LEVEKDIRYKKMAESRNTIIKLIKRYIQELEKHQIPIQEAFLFGSWTNNRAREYSDIDVALISPAFTNDRFEMRRKIVPLRRNIDNRIEPMPYTPENFAYGGILIDEIKRTGIRVLLQNIK
jgi:uncharacterized protein